MVFMKRGKQKKNKRKKNYFECIKMMLFDFVIITSAE